ncbi:MAG: TIGR04283 family arsenosugar biosynthesis glycosyltransferase [Algoriphagus sp.]|uniref:TIGR04283 family arsenosugar biosynthesis glycosyltransferase n=1 Tax=Algoriphagus sp. TaxID=1872435 RepID=UPI00260CF26C|nr:TIGR04283 family arsenosugar biosynthesis glycosyltransferase [Algoriphagus sp.]MDG1277211.1 TIGR04283 family arsenosugar biosynthesis glycosyltransferase [Algoriphagus sp.]
MSSANTISIIIPVWNEANNLEELLPILLESKRQKVLEVLVVDGGSVDDSIDIAKRSNARVISSPLKSRAVQLNLGAQHANGDILYFIHADTRPLMSFDEDILQEVSYGIEAGCYRYKFDSTSRLLKINSWFTRFNGIFAGGGDQTLFISKSLINHLGGYNERFTIMEDFELVKRIRKITKFKVIQKSILVSARKYETNSWLSVQWANFLAIMAFRIGVHPETIKTLYSNRLNKNLNQKK